MRASKDEGVGHLAARRTRTSALDSGLVGDRSTSVEPESGGPASDVLTFLIADVRGYTRFSQEQGDEAAARLARRFAEIVREAVPGNRGELIELRGDEALSVFRSARKAVSAAVDLQRRLRERIDGEPALPLGVGIGLDAGEAVPIEGGYRGRALNVAARLCSLAGPGQILASGTVASLAGRVDGATYARRRPARLKGLEDPVPLVEVIPEVELPPLPPPMDSPSILRQGPRLLPARLRGRKALLSALIVVALLAAAAAIAAATRWDTRPDGVVVVPNSVAVIDPSTNRVVEDITGVGDGPTRIEVGEGRVWVLNRDSQTITVLDPETRTLVTTFAVHATPADVATGAGSLWVGDSAKSSVVRLDADSRISGATIRALPLTPPPLGPRRADAGKIAFGFGSAWFLSGSATLSRIDASTDRVAARIRYEGFPLISEAFVAVGDGAVWISACCSFLIKVDPRENSVEATISLATFGPVAVGGGGAWVTDADNDTVWQVDTGVNRVLRSIEVGSRPLDVAIGEGAVWVANGGDGTVSRIDPKSNSVTRTIDVGGAPAGITTGAGAVWVAVG